MDSMSTEEELEAQRFAEMAARAEARAAARAAERKAASKEMRTKEVRGEGVAPGSGRTSVQSTTNNDAPVKATFMSKKKREELALQRLAEKQAEQDSKRKALEESHQKFLAKEKELSVGVDIKNGRRNSRSGNRSRENASSSSSSSNRSSEGREEITPTGEYLDSKEKDGIRKGYLGHSEGSGLNTKREKKKFDGVTKKRGKASLFTFEWDATDDTLGDDLNPLYNQITVAKPMFGRGNIAGMDASKQQSDKERFLQNLKRRRVDEGVSADVFEASVTARKSTAAVRRNRYNLEDASTLVGWEEKALEEMTERDWRIFREEFDIRVQGGVNVMPIRQWSEADLPAPLSKAIEHVGYAKPSPIQRQAVPIGMQRRDLIGIAETGSGKTCAFLLPMLTYLLTLPKEYKDKVMTEGPLALIMAPTRELAQQIEEEAIRLCKFTAFKTVCIVGGQSIQEQSQKLRDGREIVVGTPGRMVDCIENSFLILNQCYYVVLDEADRMVDMGFEPQVNAVLEGIGGELKPDDAMEVESRLSNGQGLFRVTAMFSATMTPEVERLAKTYLRHPVIVKIGDDKSGKNKRIKQEVVFTTEGGKKTQILDLLRRTKRDDKIIVFANMKKTTDVLARALENAHYYVGVLHGGKTQDQREDTLEAFRRGDANVLVATDVASRGLDIPDVMMVINYDMAKDIETYTHRIGRTGRAGKSGHATTLITDGDHEVFSDLKTYLESCGAQVPQQLRKAVALGGFDRDQPLG